MFGYPAVLAVVRWALPVLAFALSQTPPPAGLSDAGWNVALVAGVMAIWWMMEAVPLAITALIPVLAFPLLGVGSIDDVAGSYAHPLIFLFLGGFMLARAMERWGLHRRLAISVVRLGGTQPRSVIASLMAVSAFLSLWISNTATAMVMLPIGQSLVGSRQSGRKNAKDETAFGTALMLGIAYAATIGGIGSLIGTPPNALFASYMKDAHGIEIGFAQWMLIGMPVALILLPATWWLLTAALFPVGRTSAKDIVPFDGLGPLEPGGRRVAAVMLMVAALWILRPAIEHVLPGLGLSDPGIAVAGALLLFIVPADASKGEFLLNWEDATRIRWDILILFGGGLALAAGISESGLAGWIGDKSGQAAHLPPILIAAIVTVAIVYLGELASNTAIAAVFLPVAGAIAVGTGASPLSLALPITLAASLGFMLPVATPPNAIVFGSGAVTMNQMLRAGAVLDIIGMVVVLAIGMLLGPIIFATP